MTKEIKINRENQINCLVSGKKTKDNKDKGIKLKSSISIRWITSSTIMHLFG